MPGTPFNFTAAEPTQEQPEVTPNTPPTPKPWEQYAAQVCPITELIKTVDSFYEGLNGECILPIIEYLEYNPRPVEGLPYDPNVIEPQYMEQQEANFGLHSTFLNRVVKTKEDMLWHLTAVRFHFALKKYVATLSPIPRKEFLKQLGSPYEQYLTDCRTRNELINEVKRVKGDLIAEENNVKDWYSRELTKLRAQREAKTANLRTNINRLRDLRQKLRTPVATPTSKATLLEQPQLIQV